MPKVTTSVAVVGVLAAVTLSTGVAVAANGDRQLGRIAGDSRFTTAVEISKEAFPDGAAAVYLARADNFVDALPGSALTRRGPILLVPQCGTVPAAVVAEVNRLQPIEVTALGGSGAVCDAVLAQFAGALSDAAPGSNVTIVQGPGAQNSDSFVVEGGDYAVTYAFSGDCEYGAFLEPVRSGGSFFGETIANGSGPFTGSTVLYDVPPIELFVEVLANDSTTCPYRITFTAR